MPFSSTLKNPLFQVYREVRVYGFHPREQIECAFDIVTPTEGSLLADAEIIATTDELLREFPALKDSKSYFIRLNHTLLLKGILTNCGISEEFHLDVFNVIREGERWNKAQRNAHLTSMGLPEGVINSLFDVLEHEGSASQINGVLRHMIRRRTPASQHIKQSIQDLEVIMANAKALGVKCPLVISPSLIYNPGHFSGMICQLVRKKKRGLDIMAAGGRYDHLIKSFASNISLGSCDSTFKELNQSAVGISLSMEKLVSIVSSGASSATSEQQFNSVDILIYSPSHQQSVTKEMADLASKLWGHGIKCVVCDHHQSLDEVQEFAAEFGSSFLVIVREGESAARIRSLDKDRFQEKKIPLGDTADFLVKIMLRRDQEKSDKTEAESTLSRSESVRSSAPNTGEGKGLPVQVSYNFKFVMDKKSGSMSKKRLETLISTKITSSLSLLSGNTSVEVLAIPFPKPVIKTIASILEFDDQGKFESSVSLLLEKLSRNKKELRNVCDEIQTLKFKKEISVFVLFSLDDHSFQTLIAI